MNQDKLDAERFRYLMKHHVGMEEADSHGPECPRLLLYADIRNEQAHISAVERIIKEIDEDMARRGNK